MVLKDHIILHIQNSTAVWKVGMISEEELINEYDVIFNASDLNIKILEMEYTK